MDGAGQFNTQDLLGLTLGNSNDLMVVRFSTGATTTYWMDASASLTPEFSLRLTVQSLGMTGAPFWVYAATPIDGTITGFPVHGVDMPASRNLYSLDGSFTQTSTHQIPAGKQTQGILAGKVLVPANLAVAATLTISLDMAAFIPASTNQSWAGSLYLNLWLVRSTGSATPTADFLNPGTPSAALLLPSTTLSVPNRDTGRRGPAGARGPYRRCPVTGLAVLGERMVPDGYREGTLVHPDAYDPPEPEPRPDFGDRPSWAEENS